MGHVMALDSAGFDPRTITEAKPDVPEDEAEARAGVLDDIRAAARHVTAGQWAGASVALVALGVATAIQFVGPSEAAFTPDRPPPKVESAPANFVTEEAPPSPMPMAVRIAAAPVLIETPRHEAAAPEPEWLTELREKAKQANAPVTPPPPAVQPQDTKALAMITEVGVVSKQAMDNLVILRQSHEAWHKAFGERLTALERRMTIMEAEKVVASAVGATAAPQAPQRAVVQPPEPQSTAISVGEVVRYELASVSPSMGYVRVKNPMPHEKKAFIVPRDVLPDLGKCQNPRKRGGVWEVPCEKGTIEGNG